MASVDRPEVLLLSLTSRSFLDEFKSSLIDNLYESAQLRYAKTASSAIQYLEANNPRSILVIDEGLTIRENRAVLNKVVSYVRDGGLVIYGLHFSSSTRMDIFDRFFNKSFDLPWQHGDYHRYEFQLNPYCSLPTGVALNKFTARYSIKVLHIKNARPEEKIFVPVANAITQSNIFPPDYVDQAQAAVVGAKLEIDTWYILGMSMQKKVQIISYCLYAACKAYQFLIRYKDILLDGGK